MVCEQCDGHGTVCATCKTTYELCECIKPPAPITPRSELRTTTCPGCGGCGKRGVY